MKLKPEKGLVVYERAGKRVATIERVYVDSASKKTLVDMICTSGECVTADLSELRSKWKL
jgi:hypothetical protein